VASVTVASGDPSERHLWDGFGFTTSDVPSGATIDGIEVRYETASAFSGDLDVQLHEGAVALGTAKTDSPATATVHTLGGAADVWGTTLTDTQVRASDFGIVADASAASSTTIEIDYFEVRVHYTPAPVSLTGSDIESTVDLDAPAATISGLALTATDPEVTANTETPVLTTFVWRLTDGDVSSWSAASAVSDTWSDAAADDATWSDV